MAYHRTCNRPTRRWLTAGATVLTLCSGVSLAAQSPQTDDFEAALATAAKGAPTDSVASARTAIDGNGTDTVRGGRGGGTSRYSRRNNLTVEERRADPNRAPRGLVPTEFRGIPASPEHLERANTAILRRKMDPYAYLVGATAGTVLPPDARLVACGGNDRHLFYTLGTEAPVLLHNMAMRQSAGGATRAIPRAIGVSPAAAIAKAAAFLKAHGYRAVPTWLERNLYAPADERPGRASVRVSITENAMMAITFCGFRGETPPPSGPGLQVRVHFPG